LKKYIFLLKRKLLFTFVLFYCISSFAQKTGIPDKCDSVYYASILDSLKETFPNCRNIPAEFELAFYTAISHYPELKNINIEMKLKSFNFTMAARPAKKLFANRKKRIYRMYANIKKNFIGILPGSVNYNQKVGVIGHELAHVLDYSGKSLCQLVGNGIGYMYVPFRRKLEAKTDLIAIKHGLGWQMYDFEDFLMNRSTATEKYKKKKRKVYYDEKEIKRLILNNSE
jgi:hypothetical protein